MLSPVGYTTADISYKWADGEKSVRISPDVELPQFKVLGHQQKTIVVSLLAVEKVVRGKNINKISTEKLSEVHPEPLNFNVI